MPTAHDDYTRQILDAVAAGRPISQRSLARELGVALGLTNLLVRRLVSKGFIKVLNVRPRRVRYLITPAGIAEKARITRAYLENTVRLYTQTREQIRVSFLTLSASWPSEDGSEAGAAPRGAPEAPRDDNGGEKRVVFYGAGEVAEIGYIGLQTTDLRLVGVVDDYVRAPFFGLPVHRPEDLRCGRLNGETFSRIVLMSFRSAELMRARLEGLGFPPDQVYVLLPGDLDVRPVTRSRSRRSRSL